MFSFLLKIITPETDTIQTAHDLTEQKYRQPLLYSLQFFNSILLRFPPFSQQHPLKFDVAS